MDENPGIRSVFACALMFSPVRMADPDGVPGRSFGARAKGLRAEAAEIGNMKCELGNEIGYWGSEV